MPRCALTDYFSAVHPLDGGTPFTGSDRVAPSRIVWATLASDGVCGDATPR